MSANCTPSPEDITVIKRLQQAGEILGVEINRPFNCDM
ncbi:MULTISPECIES: hypothetical protein [unclassified Lysinibacillus]